MKNKQESTKIDKNYLYQSLDPEYQDAILYVFAGWQYERIAKELHVKYSTVRSWFEKGGVCKDAYEELKKEHAKENLKRIKKLNKIILLSLPDMVDVLISSAKRGNWRAAVCLLDRGGYMPYKRIESKDKNDEIDLIEVVIVNPKNESFDSAMETN